MRNALAIGLLALTVPFWAGAQSVQGTYRLVTFDGQVDGDPPHDYFGKSPKGYLIITPTRLMTVISAEGRRAARSPGDKAALIDTLLAYTGAYRIEGNKVVTAVDVSWNEAWNGTQQGRTFTVDGNRLTLVTDPFPFGPDPARSFTARLIWEKLE